MKRKTFFWMLLLLTVLPVAALASGDASFVVQIGDWSALFSQGGEILTPRDHYLYIEEVSKEGAAEKLFAAYFEDVPGHFVCELLNGRGNAVSDQTFDYLYPNDERTLLAVRDKKYGVVSLELSPIVECAYTQLVPNGEGGYLALNSDPFDERPDGVYYILPDGEERATGVRVNYGLGAYREGLMPAMAADSGRMGYLDAHGDWAIPPQFEYVGDFIGGRAEACLDSGAGLIGLNGNWLLTPKYATVALAGKTGDLILAQSGSTEIVLLDPETLAVQTRFLGQDIYFSAYADSDIVILFLDDRTLVVDKNGQTLLESEAGIGFDAYSAPGGSFVSRLGFWGERCAYIHDEKGKRVAGPYQDILPLGLIDGKEIFACATFETKEEIDSEVNWHFLSEVPGTRRVEIIDQDGKSLLPPVLCAFVTYCQDAGVLIYDEADAVRLMTPDGGEIAKIAKESPALPGKSSKLFG